MTYEQCAVQSALDTAPELSVVVLCCGADDLADAYVRTMVRQMEEAGIDYALILVANYMPGSQDRTPDVVKALAAGNERIRYVAKEKQGMMGWDLRSGLAQATGAYIAMIDGDGQMPSSDVIRVYRLIKSGGQDMVKTYRTQRDDGWMRWLISVLFNGAFRMMFWSAAFRDINAKPKILTRAAYAKMHLLSNDWFADAEIMIEALHHRMIVSEIPTVFYKNERRLSFVHYTAIVEFLRNLLYYRFVRFPPFLGRSRSGH